jgi:four helix bundle protein
MWRGRGIERREFRRPSGVRVKFEDLQVWKRATQLSANIYKGLRALKDYGFRDQITRSGLSIPSNIAEGFERTTQQECLAFLSYAKGSCGELRTQIYIGNQIGYIPEEIGRAWIDEATEISSMISGLIRTKRRFLQKDGGGFD